MSQKISKKVPSENGEFNKKLPQKKARKLPEIRQTLTSQLRILKANPLLQLENKDKSFLKYSNSLSFINLNVSSVDELSKKLSFAPTSSKRNKSVKNKSEVKSTPNLTAKSIRSESVREYKFIAKIPKVSVTIQQNPTKKIIDNTKLNSNSSTKNFIASNKKNLKRSDGLKPKKETWAKPSNLPPKKIHTNPKNSAKEAPNKKNETTEKPVRRSLSSEYFNHKRRSSTNQIHFKPLKSSQSFEEIKNQHSRLLRKQEISPIIEEIHFKSPSAYERRSIVTCTPNTTNRRSRSSNLSRISEPAVSILGQRLNDWLKKRGKNLNSFQHLKCFGIHDKIAIGEGEDKENVAVNQDLNKGSFEDLNITQTIIKDDEESPKLNNSVDEKNSDELRRIAKDALMDLHRLITEDYPREQCEAWLQLIHEKYVNLQEEPQYWECRAAIEQTRGNITSAVEYYKTAIVQGAEVDVVDKSLDQLLEKFSLLNINTDQNKNSKTKAKLVQDARNIFKSSIIQFAVQERTLKTDLNEKKKLIATPVRRSTRKSKSGYTSTPGIKIYSSLKNLEDPFDFHYNNFLN